MESCRFRVASAALRSCKYETQESRMHLGKILCFRFRDASAELRSCRDQIQE